MAFARRRNVLTEAFLKSLHKRMFRKVWKWAGAFRTSERNLGIEPHRISVELRMLLDDAEHWVDHRTYPPEETAVRFHHRLVFIHPFPNGNGRHARLASGVGAARCGARFRKVSTTSGAKCVPACAAM